MLQVTQNSRDHYVITEFQNNTDFYSDARCDDVTANANQLYEKPQKFASGKSLISLIFFWWRWSPGSMTSLSSGSFNSWSDPRFNPAFRSFNPTDPVTSEEMRRSLGWDQDQNINKSQNFFFFFRTLRKVYADIDVEILESILRSSNFDLHLALSKVFFVKSHFILKMFLVILRSPTEEKIETLGAGNGRWRQKRLITSRRRHF